MKFILGEKLKMTQMYDKDGNQTPVTLIEAGPCFVTQVKEKSKDNYEAVQVGFKKLEDKKIKKTQKGKPFKYLREFRIDELGIKNYEVGRKIDASIFQEGELVKISGISKGKGFAGVVKRWGFHGRPTTRGTKHEVRAPGSIGGATPHRVIKGHKMAGRMGGGRITTLNLKIVKIDLENNLLAVLGAVPGRKGTFLEINNER